ncbi:uncharacterized protein CXorf38 homolog isoform X2 [Gigantopelta aegis]|nr:uncharacterized protein CXorf38 homolog isoform X2 [Gigantopelta aegis]XP_041377936.1 uncharacterized protein CXorf38 homolog isoform X2 [Gigantopelta aegis]
MGQQTSRQEFLNEEMTDPRTRDWFTLNLALRESTEALAICIHHKISVLHKRSRRAQGNLPACHRNCSQTQDSQWCATCNWWKGEIYSLCKDEYKQRINWSRYHSAQWPLIPYEFARVFIPRAHRLYYKSNEFHEDIRFSLSLLENCEEFNIPKELIQKAWVVRNSFRRKGKMKIRKSDLNQGIKVLLDILSMPEIESHEAIPPAIQKLKTLSTSIEENGCCIL